jgi:hypothetical protein
MTVLGQLVRGLLLVVGLALQAVVAAQVTGIQFARYELSAAQIATYPWIGLGFEFAAVALAVGAVARAQRDQPGREYDRTRYDGVPAATYASGAQEAHSFGGQDVFGSQDAYRSQDAHRTGDAHRTQDTQAVPRYDTPRAGTEQPTRDFAVRQDQGAGARPESWQPARGGRPGAGGAPGAPAGGQPAWPPPSEAPRHSPAESGRLGAGEPGRHAPADHGRQASESHRPAGGESAWPGTSESHRQAGSESAWPGVSETHRQGQSDSPWHAGTDSAWPGTSEQQHRNNGPDLSRTAGSDRQGGNDPARGSASDPQRQGTNEPPARQAPGELRFPDPPRQSPGDSPRR